ncbi:MULTISPECIES: hypothetical protein [Paraburkholderia]|uniref:hypothetical protein n=1 Tax=Paraburkholderia TaxID=1822464 RepID=UPI0003A58C7F|nr:MULTISPECIES: hypothetical protein [Paraburkholderia]MDH6153447.1 DNA-binding response OmpR family regulator [Paraburkholderia sp. WSM4179]
MRILLIEDDMRASQFLARGLSESGLIVDSVADGATGLAYAREGIWQKGFLVSDCGYRRISESVQVGPQSENRLC